MELSQCYNRSETTYQNDYKFPKQSGFAIVKWPKNSTEIPQRVPDPAIQVNHETLQRGRPDTNVPFDIFFNLDPITHTVPQEPFIVEELIPPDSSKKKRGPRCIQSPAVALDDADELLGGDASTKELLRQYTYTSDMAKGTAEAAPKIKPLPRNKPNCSWESMGPDQVRLRLDPCRPLPPGWTRLATDWDKLQSRHVADPNAAFWNRIGPKLGCPCSDPYEKLYTPKFVKNIATLVREDRLRLPHDIPVSTYAGYIPRNPTGIPLEKSVTLNSDAWLPVSSAFTVRTASASACQEE